MTSRQRKDEVERLNEQLRKINMSLRQQARAGTIYAPGLTYVPPSLNTGGGSSAYPVETMPVPTPATVADSSDVSDADSREWEPTSSGACLSALLGHPSPSQLQYPSRRSELRLAAQGS